MQAYEVKQFSLAVQLFEKEYNSTRNLKDKPVLAYYLGESYTMLNDPANAAKWYHQAYKDGYGPEAMGKYAESLKMQEKYDEAIWAYEVLLKDFPTQAEYRSNITLCRQAIDWKRNSDSDYDSYSLIANESSSDYSPYPLAPDLILFTSDRDSKESDETYLWTGRAYSDLYVYNANTKLVMPFEEGINSKENEGTAVVSPDGNTIVFTRCYVDNSYDAWCKLMITHRRGNDWTTPEALPFTQDKVNYGHPAFAANGTTLFFSSDLANGQGGHDLYFSLSDEKEQWAEPINLGPAINSIGDELYPTVYRDTLYYSSNHLAGLGGLDIFKTYQDIQGDWVPPQNLRSPINSGGDDFGFVVDTFATPKENVLLQGYFTSSRAGAANQDDIYSFVLKGTQEASPLDTAIAKEEPVEEKVDYQLFLALRITEPIFEDPQDPNSRRVGKHPLPNGPVIITEGGSDQRMVTDEMGQLLLKLDWDKQYSFTARYRDHLAVTYELNTGEVERSSSNPITTINKVLELDPIFKNTEIILENIFYDYDQWYIRDDAQPTLDALSAILKSNPSIRIQLSSHTDCRGTDEYNLDLSQKRAQAAIDYLMSVGIPAKRLQAVGIGESQPAVDCLCDECSEDQHQTNRRTTFKIID